MPDWWCSTCAIGWTAEARIPCWCCGSLDPETVTVVVVVWLVR